MIEILFYVFIFIAACYTIGNSAIYLWNEFLKEYDETTKRFSELFAKIYFMRIYKNMHDMKGKELND